MTCESGSASRGRRLFASRPGPPGIPKTGKRVELGLPWGTKPRLILAHLNAEALRQKSPKIEVESSLSAFVKRVRGFKHGREFRLFKDQLSRLSVALVRLAMTSGDRAFQVNTNVITAFELWPELDDFTAGGRRVSPAWDCRLSRWDCWGC